MHCYIAYTFVLKRTHKTIQSPLQHMTDNQPLTWASAREVERSGKRKESTSVPGLLHPFQISRKSTGNEVGLRMGKKVQSDKVLQLLSFAAVQAVPANGNTNERKKRLIRLLTRSSIYSWPEYGTSMILTFKRDTENCSATPRQSSTVSLSISFRNVSSQISFKESTWNKR